MNRNFTKRAIAAILTLTLVLGSCTTVFAGTSSSESTQGMATHESLTPIVGTASSYTQVTQTIRGNTVFDSQVSSVKLAVCATLLAGVPYIGPILTGSGWLDSAWSLYQTKNLSETKIYYTITIRKSTQSTLNMQAFQYSVQFTNQAGTVKYGSPGVKYITYVN